jgi:hypothetical protein
MSFAARRVAVADAEALHARVAVMNQSGEVVSGALEVPD